MKFLLDTDTIVYFLRGDKLVREHIAEAGREAFAISIVTLAELRYGAAHSSNADANNTAIDDFSRGIAIVGLDDHIARDFGEIKTQLRHAGQLIPDFDLLIGATARVYDLVLVTFNLQHFRRIPNLKLLQRIR